MDALRGDTNPRVNLFVLLHAQGSDPRVARIREIRYNAVEERRSQERRKNGAQGSRKIPRIPRDKFTRRNRSHSVSFPPTSRSSVHASAARFTVLLIRQRRLVSEDTLYINFGYRGGDLSPAFLRRSNPARLAGFIALRFWLLGENTP